MNTPDTIFLPANTPRLPTDVLFAIYVIAAAMFNRPCPVVKVQMFGEVTVVACWWRDWVDYMARADKRTVDADYQQLRIGLITKVDSPVFSDYWKARA